jgi:formamidopyrimidine-DNA glycosylase
MSKPFLAYQCTTSPGRGDIAKPIESLQIPPAIGKLNVMPELPDITAYITALEARILGQPLEHVRIASAFLLRTAQPAVSETEGKTVRELRRVGKRIAIGVDGELWLVLHLMIAGRLHWRAAGAKLAGRNALAAFDFPNGTLVLTEAGSKRRASLHIVAGEAGLEAMNPGGIEIFASDVDGFRKALTAENRTLRSAHSQRHRQFLLG